MDEYNAGVNAEAAAQPDSESAEHVGEERTVPLEALQSIRDELKELKSENRGLKDNLMTYSNHFEMMNAQQRKQESNQNQDAFDGATDDDLITVGQARKFADQMQQYSQSVAKQTQQSTAELQMMASNPDYKDVINKYLPLAMEEDPDLKREIQSASNPYKYAYKMAKRSTAYMKDASKSNLSPQSQKVLDNYTQPKSLSSVGNPAPVSPQGKYRAMSNNDFRALVAKNAGLA